MNDGNSPMVPTSIIEHLRKLGIIAVLTVEDANDAVDLARLLLDNGIQGMELTLRTGAAMDALQAIQRSVPEMFAGVGTILTPQQVQDVKASGAPFGVAPGYNREVVAAAASAGLPFAPGISTPSELEVAYSQGCNVLKFFHAEGMGGVKYLKSINGPYGHLGLQYIPLGGVGPHNLRDYLNLNEVLAIGGSWIAPVELIRAKDWTAIARNAKEAASIFHEVRGPHGQVFAG